MNNQEVFIFPLHGALLMPGTNLPLYVFEKRYVKMIEDSLERDIPITVLPINSNNQYQNEICTIGKLQILNKREDGTYDIILIGINKCKLTNLISDTPYYSFEYQDVFDNEVISEKSEQDLLFLREYIWNWTQDKINTPQEREQIKIVLKDNTKLISYLTIFLIGNTSIRKNILTANNYDQKIDIIMQTLLPNSIYMGPFLPSIEKS